MQLPDEMMLTIAIITGLVGLVFLYLPERIRSFEAWLNLPCGNHQVAALRMGLHVEQSIEHALNRIVTSRQIIWDDWLLEHPRLTGMVMCALALKLVVSL